MNVRRIALLWVAAGLFIAGLSGCSSNPESAELDTGPVGSEATGDESAQDATDDNGAAVAGALYPDVVGVEAERDDDGTWTFSVTLSSPYDSPARYADGWRVIGPDGAVYGERVLGHDHADEQPFTRSQSGISIPDGIETVVVEGRDQVSGWGGHTMTHQLVP